MEVLAVLAIVDSIRQSNRSTPESTLNLSGAVRVVTVKASSWID